MKGIKVAFAIILSLFVLFMCKPQEDDGDNPALPPDESMSPDFSSIVSSSNSAPSIIAALDSTLPPDVVYPAATPTNNHKFWASAYVGIFNFMTAIALAVPRYIFKQAVDQSPTMVDDNTWKWEYSGRFLLIPYEAVLTATVSGTKILWVMEITYNKLTNFKWFDGETDVLSTSGFWQFYNSDYPDESRTYLHIDWDITLSNDSAYLILSNNNIDSTNFGTMLSYARTNDNYIVNFKKTNGEQVKIEWNKSTMEGSITYPDGSSGSWDSNGNDVVSNN